MNGKDPPPFGYTFNGFFDADLTSLDTSGQSLLSDMEHQSLTDFFSNTDPFHLSDAQAYPLPAADAKDDAAAADFSNWNNFITPATVHRVSTTIPDQAHLHHAFDLDPAYAHPPLPTNYAGTTNDGLQPASTHFTNSHPPYPNGTSQDFHAPAPPPPPPSQTGPSRNATMNSAAEPSQTSKPMVFTSHGLIDEQLAVLLPNHSEHGSLDAQLAARWATSSVVRQHEAEYATMLHRPNLKRTYDFGTDDSFNNPAGFSAPRGQETEEQVTRRLMRELRHSQSLVPVGGTGNGSEPSPTGPVHLPLGIVESPSDDEGSEEGTSEEGEGGNGPAKKRRKSKHEGSKKAVAKGQSRNGKTGKGSLGDEGGKKKRGSAASQKMQRENLTEEQKRNNHILSEQKRRNLIKRGFDDLHDLVPEIRNGGLSKSSVLMEAANFLDKLVQENAAFARLIRHVKAE